MKRPLIGLCVFLCVCISVEAQSVRKPDLPSIAEKPEIAEYVIGLEDVLSVSVWREPELSLKEVVVRPDGKISLPLVNEMQANGLTTRQLQDGITEKLKEFVDSPNVTVTILKVVSQSVSVVGQVGRPGAYPVGAPITIVELLARAGGLTEFAKAKSIRVIRVENGKTLQFPFNYKEVVQGKNLQQNIILKKGDVVMVP